MTDLELGCRIVSFVGLVGLLLFAVVGIAWNIRQRRAEAAAAESEDPELSGAEQK